MNKVLLLIIVAVGGFTCFSQEKQLIFSDDSSLAVSNSTLERRTTDRPGNSSKPSVKIFNKEFIAFLTGIGKAVPPLNAGALKSLGAKNKSFAAQIRKIDSAYGLIQDDSKFYFAGLNSIKYEGFENCAPQKPCKVKLQAAVVEVSKNSGKENIVILKSFKML